ncbi:hypothetical protein LOTGIDRAFT_161039 [Lottia gigantea]|uniref:Uncharacterized protein n=1 Tax=Lottia gigantea TaxID=225164 RepID=V3ZTJ7_LOTGI|nr:hypothetical protein LOTGIDRAFT_161039 [Lottia gigantea]ESO94788.1 hypothetical protein LOTGIDRAFT_161039 [Lottia gigantea]
MFLLDIREWRHLTGFYHHKIVTGKFIKQKLDDSENRHKANNLIFYGIKEGENNVENSESVIREVFKELPEATVNSEEVYSSLSIHYLRPVFPEINDGFQESVFLKFDIEYFGYEHTVIYGTLYVAPEYSKIHGTEFGIADIDDKLLLIEADYPRSDFILMGDFNARTGNGEFDDCLVDDSISYLTGLKNADYRTDPFNVGRHSKDNELNNFGKELLRICATFNRHIVNGRVENDRLGESTCIKYNGASVVDYVIVSSDLFKCVTSFNIDCKTESDHMPLSFEMSCKLTQNSSEAPSECLQPYSKLVWKEDRADIYNSRISENINDFVSIFQTILSKDIESALNEFQSFIYKCAYDFKSKSIVNYSKKQQPPWIDYQCLTLKQNKSKLLQQFRKSNKVEHLVTYKNICKHKKVSYPDQVYSDLCNNLQDPNQFWKTLKSYKPRNEISPNISPEE